MKAKSLDTDRRWPLYAAALVCDAFIMQFGQTERFSAWETTWAVLLDTALLCGLVVLLWSNATAERAGRLWYGVSGAALLLSSACIFLDMEQFYRFCIDTPLPEAITLAVLLLVAFYACDCGWSALSRATGLLLWLLAASAVLLWIANLDKLQVTNLQPAEPKAGNLLRACVVYFRFPSALLLFGVLPSKQEGALPVKKMTWGLIGLAVVQISGAILSELVLGTGAQQYSQTMYTLARLGGLSVFHRLDAIHLCVWLLAMLMKCTILLCAAAQALYALKPALSAGKRRGILFVLLFITIVAAAAMHSAVRQAAVTSLSALAACVLSVQGRTIWVKKEL
ncbi:MAG: GerAB/ArcD/ProY family transporter [Ruthenibacterium sp.]